MSIMPTVDNGAAPIQIDHTAILTALNLNPRDPKTQALLLVCDRYGLDPLLKHAVLIQGSLYVTRDGYLSIAHRSGQFDGMEVVEQGADQTHYWAKVAVYRKDMGRPITMIGRFPKAKPMAKEYGPEMAVKCSEVAALRRAFNVTGVSAADERWDYDETDRVEARREALDGAAGALAPFTEADETLPLPSDVPLAETGRIGALLGRIGAVRAASPELAADMAKEWKAQQIRAVSRPERFTVADADAAEALVTTFEEEVAKLAAGPVQATLGDAS